MERKFKIVNIILISVILIFMMTVPENIFSKTENGEMDFLITENMRFSENSNGVKHLKQDMSLLSYTNMEVYENEDGSSTAYLFDEPVRYLAMDEDGDCVSYKEIDSSIVSTTESDKDNFKYKNAENSFDIYFPSKFVESEAGILVSSGGINYNIKPQKYNSKECVLVKEQENKISYPEAFGKNTILEYTVNAKGYKDDIILLNKDVDNIFNYEIKTEEDFEFVLDAETSQWNMFVDKINVWSISPVILYDAEYKFSINNKMHFEKINKNLWRLQIIADKEFISNDSTIYPVHVDPTVILNGSDMGPNMNAMIHDATVFSDVPSTNMGGYIKNFIGKFSVFGVSHTYVKFDIPWIDLNVASITSAYYKVYESSDYDDLLKYKVYYVDNPWEENTITWENKPTATYAMSSTSVAVANNQWNYIDLKQAFIRWLPSGDDMPTSFGIALKSEPVYEALGYYKGFNSKENMYNRPTVEISYNTDLNVKSSGIYFIRNYHTNQYLSDTGVVSKYPYHGGTAERFKILRVNGNECRIRSMNPAYENYYLYMNGNKLDHTTTVNNDSIFKIQGLGIGYVTIKTKASNFEKFLYISTTSTPSLTHDYSPGYNNIWVLEPCVAVNVDYDGRYIQRGGTNTLTGLKNVFNQLAFKFYDAAAIRIVPIFSQVYSLADACSAGIDSFCTHATNANCTDYYYYSQGYNSYHHKNWGKMLSWAAVQAKNDPNNSQYTIKFMITGAGGICEKDEGNLHYETGSGMAYVNGRTAIYQIRNLEDSFLSGLVHELTHNFGASHHHYDGIWQCVMGKDCNDETIIEDRMFCESCIALIRVNAARLSTNRWN